MFVAPPTTHKFVHLCIVSFVNFGTCKETLSFQRHCPPTNLCTLCIVNFVKFKFTLRL